MSEPWLVIGLGNPGPKYAYNRHNVGYLVVGELLARARANQPPGEPEPALSEFLARARACLTKHKSGASVADVRLGLTKHKSGASVADVRLGLGPGGAPGPRAILAITNTYMNVSGAPVRALADFYSVEPGRLLVVHDDLDLPTHTLRLKRGGGEGGHNGLKSITQHIGTRDYGRLRVGIDRPPGRMDPADYVLQNFPAGQRQEWGVSVVQAADVVEQVAGAGFEAAQMRLHSA